MIKKNPKYDIVVIGGGHAGCEAVHIANKMGAKTALVSMNLKKIAAMPCNPAIGGPGKGHLVKEIDALGGIMGKLADKTLIQIRMLNTSKGPAVQAYRAQIEREDYSKEMLKLLKREKNLTLIDDEAIDVKEKGGKIDSVILKKYGRIKTRAVIVATGTFLNGEIFIGNKKEKKGGRIDAPSSDFLSKSLKKFGLSMGRLKTGTPPRILKDSVDFSKAIAQPGTDGKHSFSFPQRKVIDYLKQIPCYLTYTNQKTHNVIKKYKKESPVFSGTITEAAPRHCPSLDRKVLRFPDKKSHPVFIEPLGRKSNLLYLQGCSISFPLQIQKEILKTIPALKNVEIKIPGYAIVYDFVKPHEIKSNLETKKINNLFLAGQINGTSGYEEAGAQGIMAGINAVLSLRKKKPFILKRNEAYIGVLIDDIITKIHKDPYRIYTGSAEYRLLLRQNTADIRLSKYAYALGTINKMRMARVEAKIKDIKSIKTILTNRRTGNKSIWKLLKQPEKKLADFKIRKLEEFSEEAVFEAELEAKYEDYIRRQENMILKTGEFENKKIAKIDFEKINGLRILAKERLKDIQPETIGQASRIAGVTPADISVLLIHLKKSEA